MARTVSSGSESRARSSAISAKSSSRVFSESSMGERAGSRAALPSAPRLEVEPDQHPFGLREVADDLARRRRELAHQGRDGEDLVASGERGVGHEVDDLDPVLARQMLVADPL